MTIGKLSPSRRRLVEVMRQVRFGRIEGFAVSSGEPQFDPPPRIIRDLKFGSNESTPQDSAVADFHLKAEVIELFDELSKLGNGVIDVLEIRHGLPFRMSVATVPARREVS